MKKTIDLLNEVVAMGFENREPLIHETISDKLYEDILEGFVQEKEMDQNV